MHTSGALGSYKRKTGRLGANHLSTNTLLGGRVKKKKKKKVLTTRGLSKAGRNQEM